MEKTPLQMECVIETLEILVKQMRIDISNYYKWIAECRKSGHKYGVESYTESRNELKKALPHFTEAIKILKRYGK